MNDVPNPAPADDAELLAAYLDADLDAEAAAALEARLAAEPRLAADLEAERELRELLGGASVPEPPEGFEARLRARLDEERGPEVAAAPVTSMAARRQRRRPVNWGAMGGIAAALVAVAVVGASVLTQGASDSESAGDVAMESLGGDADTTAEDGSAREFLDAATETDAQDVQEAEEGTDSDTDRAAAEPTDATEEALEDETFAAGDDDSAGSDMAMAPQEPVILSTGTALADEEAVRAHASDLPEAHSLLGMAGQDATDTAAAFRVAVQRAEPFPSGVHPAACLDTVAGGTEGTVAPVRVEEVTYGGEPSLLYVLVVATGDAFDRVEGWVVAPDSCATGLFVNLS